LPWIEDPAAAPNSDMWAAENESRAYIEDLYRLACEHSEDVLAHVDPNALAKVAWWPAERQVTTAGALLSRVLMDTAMHAGQLQVLRELIDGEAGSDRLQVGDEQWWADYRGELEKVALRFHQPTTAQQ
jgi:Protein of unknown function (DUF664)